MSDRLKLSVKGAGPVQKIGDNQTPKLNFTAAGPDGKVLAYETWSSSLIPHIQSMVGKEIDAEVETTEKPGSDGQSYIHRKITQVFVDGKPISADKGRGGSGYGGGRFNSPEERLSIEQQVAFKGIIELRIYDKIDDKSPAFLQALAWAASRFTAIKAAPAPATPAPAKQPAAAQVTPAAAMKEARTALANEPIFPDEPPKPAVFPGYKRAMEQIERFTGLTDALKALKEDCGLQPAQVYKLLGVESQRGLKDLPPDVYKKAAELHWKQGQGANTPQ
jgi:hypothetical protein